MSSHPALPLLPTGYSISSFLQMLHPECKELPEPNLLPGQLSHGAVGVKEGRVQWISMAFESVSGLPQSQEILTPWKWSGVQSRARSSCCRPSLPSLPSTPARLKWLAKGDYRASLCYLGPLILYCACTGEFKGPHGCVSPTCPFGLNARRHGHTHIPGLHI